MKKTLYLGLACAALLAAAAPAWAGTVEELQRQVDELNDKVKALAEKNQPPTSTPPASEGSYLKKVWDGTKIGGYGELDYIFRRENGNGKGGEHL